MRLDLRVNKTDVKAASSRVWFNGEEITQSCFMADDETGEVGIYERAPGGGGILIDPESPTRQPIMHFKKGFVRIEYAANYVGTT